MTDLRRTPSVQHAVALIRDTVPETVIEMEKLEAARIPFSLNPGRRMFKLLMEGYPLSSAINQLRLDKHKKNIVPNVGLVQAFDMYAHSKKVPWFRECETHFFPIGGGIVIPVRPAGFWAESKKLNVMWPQAWKGRTLDKTQKAIFNTILRRTFFVGDFKKADLEWVDLREKTPKAGRGIEILSGEELGAVSESDLAEYLHILVSAFDEYSVGRTRRKAEEKASRKPKDSGTPLFGDPLPTSPSR